MRTGQTSNSQSPRGEHGGEAKPCILQWSSARRRMAKVSRKLQGRREKSHGSAKALVSIRKKEIEGRRREVAGKRGEYVVRLHEQLHGLRLSGKDKGINSLRG